MFCKKWARGMETSGKNTCRGNSGFQTFQFLSEYNIPTFSINPPCRAFPRHPSFQKVNVVRGKHDGGWSYHDRLAVVCTNEAHQNCHLSRSVALLVDRFGAKAPEYFIGAWLAQSTSMPGERHKKWRPNVADMERFRLNSLPNQ